MGMFLKDCYDDDEDSKSIEERLNENDTVQRVELELNKYKSKLLSYMKKCYFANPNDQGIISKIIQGMDQI